MEFQGHSRNTPEGFRGFQERARVFVEFQGRSMMKCSEGALGGFQELSRGVSGGVKSIPGIFRGILVCFNGSQGCSTGVPGVSGGFRGVS